MKKFLSLLFILFTFSFFAQQESKVENVNAADFNKAISAKNTVVIDLRTTDEIKKEGMIKGAVQIDFLAKDAEEKIAQLDRSKTYLVYCAGGGRSSDCAELMSKQGFPHVVNLQKGFSEWKKAGLPIVPLTQ